MSFSQKTQKWENSYQSVNFGQKSYFFYEYLNFGCILTTKTKTAHLAQNGLIRAAHGHMAHGTHLGDLLHKRPRKVKINFRKNCLKWSQGV